MEQLRVTPEQAPPQPLNFQPLAGAAVSVTDVPSGYVSEQSPGQLTPGGLLDTLPLPVTLTVSVLDCGGGGGGVWVNVAETLFPSSSVTTQDEEEPEQPPPLQLSSFQPEAGAAVSVINVPAGYVSAQSPGQFTPEGLLDTLPLPETPTVSARAWGGGG